MKTILILAVSALCVFSAKADDDYATVVRYLGENGHYIISPDDVAKVRAFMKANGYQHVSEIPRGALPAGGSVAEPHAAEAVPSGTPVTHIGAPSATPEPAPPTYTQDLTALAANPTSDLSSLSDEQIVEVAQLDAQSFYQAHPRKYSIEDYSFCEARALKHHLLGNKATRYQLELSYALEALSANQ
jgi:hypothetical protein